MALTRRRLTWSFHKVIGPRTDGDRLARKEAPTTKDPRPLIEIVLEPGEHNWGAYGPNVPGCAATGKDRKSTLASS